VAFSPSKTVAGIRQLFLFATGLISYGARAYPRKGAIGTASVGFGRRAVAPLRYGDVARLPFSVPVALILKERG
jgi:hypothetical protein